MKDSFPELAKVRWDDLAAFLSVAQAGGLAGATEDAGSSAPTLSRRMHALERALGKDLFIRRSHGYALTDAGRDLVAALDGVADQIARATAPVREGALALVKISAGTWTSLALARHWARLTGTPADVRIRLVSTESFLSLTRREAAIAIRNAPPEGVGLAARKLARNDFAIYGRADAPTDWIVHKVDTPSSRWVAERAGSDPCHEVSHPRLTLDLALTGAGQVVLPTFIGDEEAALERRSDILPELSHEVVQASDVPMAHSPSPPQGPHDPQEQSSEQLRS